MEVIRRADLDFLLFDWLDVESLAKLPRFLGQTVEGYRAFLISGSGSRGRNFCPPTRSRIARSRAWSKMAG